MKKFFILSGLFVVLAGTFAPSNPATADTVLVKKGTQVDTALQQTLSSKANHNGDKFTLLEKETFFHKNPAISGATIEGHLENVTPASSTHKATLTIVFDGATLADGTPFAFPASLKSLSTFEPKTHHIRDVGLIIGGAVAGQVVAKQHHGALVGAAAGFALATSLKSDIVVKKGTLVKLKVNEDIVLTSTPSASPAPAASPN